MTRWRARRLVAFGATSFVVLLIATRAATVVIMPDGDRAIVETADGKIDAWQRGEQLPIHLAALRGGARNGVNSVIAATAALDNSRVLVVQRGGVVAEIETEAPDSPMEKIPVLGGVRIDARALEQHDDLFKHVTGVDHTSAAAFHSPNTLLLSKDDEPTIYSVELRSFMAQSDYAVPVTGILRIWVGDSGVVITKIEAPVPFAHDLNFPFEEKTQITTMASCGNSAVIGTEGGTVYSIALDGDNATGARMRQVGDEAVPTRGIIHAGCVSSDLGFTTSFPTAHGQVQLWDLRSMKLLSEADTEGGWAPLITYDGVASSDRKYLLTVGDIALRIFSVGDRKLIRSCSYFIDNAKLDYGAAATRDGNFLVYDGSGLRIITPACKPVADFAGKPFKANLP